jgi:Phenylpropionate dioxygenase and related ring-hydroxylating dioxygenases, large terminal subunit
MVATNLGLAPETYYDPGIYADEIACLFRRHWQMVGLARTVARHNDFLRARIAGTEIVVQNFDGDVRGFRNVCTHRHALVHEAPCGNGPLRCPYHGWTYNRDGVPVGIPGNDEHFGLDRAGKERMAMEPVEVVCWGAFVFARLEPGGPPVEDWLGGMAPILAELGALFTEPFDCAGSLWAANWKIAAESALEGYHIPFVHRDSFYPLTGRGDPVVPLGTHSYGRTFLSAAGHDSIDRYATRLGLARSDRFVEYDHFFLFPNMMVIASGGTVFGLQRYDPEGPESTRLHHWMLLGPSSKPAQRNSAAGRAVEKQLVEFNIAVLAEDRLVSESAQRGKRQISRPALLGANEERIALFHNHWRSAMEPAAAGS